MSGDPGDEAERRAQILRGRARSLAARPDEGAKRPVIEVLRFRLGAERYAIESRHAIEVHPLRQLAPIPCCPRHIVGVVNARGRMLPVVDLRKFFELSEAGLADLHRVIHVVAEGLEFGLLADMGLDTHELDPASLQPPPATLGGARAEYVLGLGEDALILLDAGRIARDPRMVVDQEVSG
jgi:purine-binding chemotaxis protein CheW